MDDYYVTIVHNKEDTYCKLLVIGNNYAYWSENGTHKSFIHFKSPSKIAQVENALIIYSKNGKDKLVLTTINSIF